MTERLERERRYVADYAAQKLPPGSYITNVPMGAIPAEIIAKYGLEAGRKLFQPSRPRIDLVHWLPNHYYLIECKIREPKQAVGDLLYYLGLAPATYDLPNYSTQKFVARLVVPWIIPSVRTAAEHYGFEIVEFLPPWVEDYVRERQHYFSSEYKTVRDEKMRLRKSLGVE
jgi:hypothetical protein